MSYQKDITAKSLSDILRTQKSLKRLNLTQTQVNDKVLHLIADNCKNLEELSLKDCKAVYDDCLLYLTNSLSKKLTSLNVDYVFLNDDCIKQILIQCIYLKFLYTENLVRVIHSLCDNIDNNHCYKFNLETIYCDNTRIFMHEEQFRTLTYSCPKLKCIHITCFGSNEILGCLQEFKHINQLLISNQSVMMYKFENHLMKYLTVNGHQLKKLHLIHINDVNIQLLIQNCMNLSELVIEFIHYYTPIGKINDYELTDIEQRLMPDLKYLTSISLSNTNCTSNKPFLNIDLFKFDLKLLIKKAINLKNLKLDRFNFIDDVFFADLVQFSFEYNAKTIEKFELIKLNQLTMNAISKNLLFHENKILSSENRFKKLNILNLIDCKQISKSNFEFAIRKLKFLNLNCHLFWS